MIRKVSNRPVVNYSKRVIIFWRSLNPTNHLSHLFNFPGTALLVEGDLLSQGLGNIGVGVDVVNGLFEEKCVFY